MIFNYLTIEWTTGSNSLGDPQTGLGGSPAQVTKKIVLCRKIKMLKVHIWFFFLKVLNQDNYYITYYSQENVDHISKQD